jgi:hypothetical protein
LNRIFVVVVSGLIGGVFGYFVGVSIGCDWLYPTSNLCGIYGMLITGPAGLLAGVLIGWRVSRAKERQKRR